MKIRLTELKTLRAATLLIALMLISYGCLATRVAPPPPQVQYKNVPQGLINTPGVTIAAEDGSFTLKYGEAFNTPFSNRLAWWNTNPPTTSKSSAWCSGIAQGQEGHCPKVSVTVPGKKKPLYGYLFLSKMHPTATGPGSRSYLIEIPQRYIDEASSGRISIVYEWVQAGNKKHTGWVLWLSDAPF